MDQTVYVHIDTTSNVVVTRGINAKDFHLGVVHPPKNLLLLNPATEYGDYETHTGLKIIRGAGAVDHYARLVTKGRMNEENKWIDFTDVSMLKELSPLEISELLYFGHMRNHLHSPFFYKLQNNFVYFDLPHDVARVYYRYLDEFYHILAGRIKQLAIARMNEKRSFFKRATTLDNLPVDLLKNLREPMKEGMIFCFHQLTQDSKVLCIPLFIAEEELAASPTIASDMTIGRLCYHFDTHTWSLDLEEENLLFI